MSFPTTSQFTILTSGATTNSGLTAADTLTVDYELVFQANNDVDLVISGISFSVAGLDQNQTNVANHLNGVFDAGGGGLGGLLVTLGNFQALSELTGALDQRSPEIYGDTQIAALYASLGFSDNLLSCRVNGIDTG